MATFSAVGCCVKWTLPEGRQRRGALAAVSLPDAPQPDEHANSPFAEPLYSEIVAARFEAFALHFPARPKRVLRVTAQIYNELSQYERLAAFLRDKLAR